jgi:hypothetical protein
MQYLPLNYQQTLRAQPRRTDPPVAKVQNCDALTVQSNQFRSVPRRITLKVAETPGNGRALADDVWCEEALRFENTKSRLQYYYVKIGSDPEAHAIAFKLPSGCYISMCSHGHHARVGVDHKEHYDPLLLLGYAQ